MGFKVASRVRGRKSDEAFREAFGTEEQCRAALVRLRWPDGFVNRVTSAPAAAIAGIACWRGRGLYQCNRCKKQTSPHGGHDLPRDQAAADTLVRRHPPDRDGKERHLVGGTRPPSRGQTADGLGREAQDHAAVMARREGEITADGAGGDGRCLSRRSALRRQAGPRRGGQDALRGGGLDQSRGAPAQC